MEKLYKHNNLLNPVNNFCGLNFITKLISRNRDVAQMVELVPSMVEALDSLPDGIGFHSTLGLTVKQ